MMPDFVLKLKRSVTDSGRSEIHRCWDVAEAEAAARLWLLADEVCQIAEVWRNGQCLAKVVRPSPDAQDGTPDAAGEDSR